MIRESLIVLTPWQRYCQNALANMKESASRSVMSNSLRPHGLEPARLPCPWDYLGKNTGVCCHFFLQGIFPTQADIISHVSNSFPHHSVFVGSAGINPSIRLSTNSGQRSPLPCPTEQMLTPPITASITTEYHISTPNVACVSLVSDWFRDWLCWNLNNEWGQKGNLIGEAELLGRRITP